MSFAIPIRADAELGRVIIAYSTLLQDRLAIFYLLIIYLMRLLIAALLNLIIFSTYLYVVLAMCICMCMHSRNHVRFPSCTIRYAAFPLIQLDPGTPSTFCVRVFRPAPGEV